VTSAAWSKSKLSQAHRRRSNEGEFRSRSTGLRVHTSYVSDTTRAKDNTRGDRNLHSSIHCHCHSECESASYSKTVETVGRSAIDPPLRNKRISNLVYVVLLLLLLLLLLNTFKTRLKSARRRIAGAYAYISEEPKFLLLGR